MIRRSKRAVLLGTNHILNYHGISKKLDKVFTPNKIFIEQPNCDPILPTTYYDRFKYIIFYDDQLTQCGFNLNILNNIQYVLTGLHPDRNEINKFIRNNGTEFFEFELYGMEKDIDVIKFDKYIDYREKYKEINIFTLSLLKIFSIFYPNYFNDCVKNMDIEKICDSTNIDLEREEYMIEQVKKYNDDNILLVNGVLHIDRLGEQLEDLDYEVHKFYLHNNFLIDDFCTQSFGFYRCKYSKKNSLSYEKLIQLNKNIIKLF